MNQNTPRWTLFFLLIFASFLVYTFDHFDVKIEIWNYVGRWRSKIYQPTTACLIHFSLITISFIPIGFDPANLLDLSSAKKKPISWQIYNLSLFFSLCYIEHNFFCYRFWTLYMLLFFFYFFLFYFLNWTKGLTLLYFITSKPREENTIIFDFIRLPGI